MFYKSLFKAADVPLEQYYEDYEYATRDSQSKFSYHVLSHLSDIYNFSLHSRESPLWSKGDVVGPIERALTNREIDITGTPISFNIRRLQVLKYVHQDWPFRSCFFFRNPESAVIQVGEVLRPLANEVWYLTSFSMLVSVAIVSMALRHDCTQPGITTLSNSLLIVLGALSQQSSDLKMTKSPIRIAFLFVMIFSLLIYNYYSASVVSVRLDDSTARINDSLVQLGKLNLRMATEDMVYLGFFLKKADWDTTTFYENYWKKIPESKQYLVPEVGMSLVRKGGFAYHTHVEIAYLYIDRFFEHREICEIIEVHLGGPLITAFGVHLNSTFVDMARVGLMRIAETGLRIRQIHRWQYRKPLCRREILTATSVTIYEFAPHIILLLIGAALSVIALAAEIFISTSGYIYIRSTSRTFVKKLLSCGQIPTQIRSEQSLYQ
ncbi:ionotropic receptor 75a-like [Phymastichus coffea]|uniref:ionotropic receptor 75a-like n=1 Tax=Phymastichus coffea TaxID=108790 RepID=UPI00273CABF9|nr:ionotropic receptor 75a-like [Phymastichus coffea]